MLVLELKSPNTGKSTLFAKLNDVYANCEYLIRDEPQLHPLICLRETCHRSRNCMEHLANRVKYIFDQWESADLLLLYFRYRDRPQFQRAGVFWRDLREPYFITMNPHSWERIKKNVTVFEWQMPESLLLGGKLHQIGKTL